MLLYAYTPRADFRDAGDDDWWLASLKLKCQSTCLINCYDRDACYELLERLHTSADVDSKTKLKIATDIFLWQEPPISTEFSTLTKWDMATMAGSIMEKNANADPFLAASVAALGLQLYNGSDQSYQGLLLSALDTIAVIAPMLHQPAAIMAGLTDRVRIEVSNIAESFAAQAYVRTRAQEVFRLIPSSTTTSTLAPKKIPTPRDLVEMTKPKSYTWLWVLGIGSAVALAGAAWYARRSR